MIPPGESISGFEPDMGQRSKWIPGKLPTSSPIDEAARAAVERVRADEARAQTVLRQAQLDHRRSTELPARMPRLASGKLRLD